MNDQISAMVEYLKRLPSWYIRSMTLDDHAVVISIFYQGGPVPSDFDLGFKCTMFWRDINKGRWRDILCPGVEKLKSLAGAPE